MERSEAASFPLVKNKAVVKTYNVTNEKLFYYEWVLITQ